MSDDETQATGVAGSDGAAARPSARRINPTKLGRFSIVRPLGSGGMGTVWEAEDPELGRRVAIKVLRSDRSDAAFTDGLRREAQALARLVHPNVVAVYDVGVDDGELFVVMQLVDGESIDAWLRRRRATPAEVVAAFCEAGKGLAAAHAAKLVHRDVKPGNVLVDREGAVRVGDFGLARMAEPGDAATQRAASESGLAIAGTPAYMAPEQFDGVATAASDQYAFCVALYEVLAGELPFAGSSLDDTNAAKARVVPMLPRSRAPARIGRALARGMSADPGARFPAMTALLAALAPPRRRSLVAAGVVAAALGAVAIAIVSRGTPQPAPATERPRALTHDDVNVCAYSPTIDGDHVVFDRTEGSATDLYVVPLAGGDERQLTSAPTWEWRASPGRRPGEILHLISDPASSTASQLAYLDVATRRDTVIADARAADAALSSTGIVYTELGGNQLRRLDGSADTTFAVRRNDERFGEITGAKHGDRVAAVLLEPDAYAICVFDLATAARDCFAKDLAIGRPAFGADDRFLYYASYDGIRQRDLATGREQVVVDDVVASGGITVASDGDVLVYSDCDGRSQIIDWSAQPPSIVEDDHSAMEISATGDAVAWTHTARGKLTAMFHRRGDGIRSVTGAELGAIEELALGPSGDRIAFRSAPPHAGIYVADVRAATIAITRVSDDPRDQLPKWLGDDELVFLRGNPTDPTSTMFVTHLDASPPRALPQRGRAPLGGSPHRLLVHAVEGGFSWIDEATGREAAAVQDVPADAIRGSVSPNGSWLVILAGSEGHRIFTKALRPEGPMTELPVFDSSKTIHAATIRDTGHVLLTAQAWAGGLHVVHAVAGSPF